MHKRLSSNAPALVVSMALVFPASPAEARIECRGNFQITKHGPLSTPYCEERQIARVARSNGITVTDAQVRNNPNTKGLALSDYRRRQPAKGLRPCLLSSAKRLSLRVP